MAAPTKPAPSAGVPTGWYSSVSEVPAGTGLIHYSIGHRERGAKLYTWSDPVPLEVRSIKTVGRNATTGVVTLTYSDGTTDSFTIDDGTDAAALTASFVTDATGNVTVTLSDGTRFTIPAGRAGRGIRSIVRNATTGVVTVTYDNGNTDTFNVVDGRDGVGITSISRSATSGVVTFTYTDGEVDTFTIRDGADGASISSTITTNADGDVTVRFSDGTNFTLPAGEDGANGRGIRSMARNAARTTVVVTYDDGTSQSFPLRDGVDGERGPIGPQGPREWQPLFRGSLSLTRTGSVALTGLSGYDALFIAGRFTGSQASVVNGGVISLSRIPITTNPRSPSVANRAGVAVYDSSFMIVSRSGNTLYAYATNVSLAEVWGVDIA